MGFIFNTDTDTGGVVAPGSITDVELAPGAVTNDKLDEGSVTLDKLDTLAGSTVIGRRKGLATGVPQALSGLELRRATRDGMGLIYASDYGFLSSNSGTVNVTGLTAAIAAAQGKTLVVEASYDGAPYLIDSSWVQANGVIGASGMRVVGIGMPIIEYTGAQMQDAQATVGENQICFSLGSTAGFFEIEGVGFKNWLHAIGHVHPTLGGFAGYEFDRIVIKKCYFEQCQSGYSSMRGVNSSNHAFTVDKIRYFEFSNNRIKQNWNTALKLNARIAEYVRIVDNDIDGIGATSTTAPITDPGVFSDGTPNGRYKYGLPAWYRTNARTWTGEVRVVDRVGVTRTGVQTVDGVSLALDDYVLRNTTSSPEQNGVWQVKAGAWVRGGWHADGTVMNSGLHSRVYCDLNGGGTFGNSEVSSYPGTIWSGHQIAALDVVAPSIANAGVTIGTTPIRFAQFGSGPRRAIQVDTGDPGTNRATPLTGEGNDLNQQVIVSRNKIRHVVDHLGPGTNYGDVPDATNAVNSDTQAMNIGAPNVIVAENHIANVRQYGFNQNEGIYVKSRWPVIRDNFLLNAGMGNQGCIAAKGGPEGFDMLDQSPVFPAPMENDGTPGHLSLGFLISGNRIIATDGWLYPRIGIALVGGLGHQVINNYMQGLTQGVKVNISDRLADLGLGDGPLEYQQYAHLIADNVMRHFSSKANYDKMNKNSQSAFGTAGLRVVAGIHGASSNLTIRGNWIEDLESEITGVNSQAYGIYLTNPGDYATGGKLKNLRIEQNQMLDIVGLGASSHGYGVWFQTGGSGTGPILEESSIIGNSFKNIIANGAATAGIYVQSTQLAEWRHVIARDNRSFTTNVFNFNTTTKPHRSVTFSHNIGLGASPNRAMVERGNNGTIASGSDNGVRSFVSSMMFVPSIEDIIIQPTSTLRNADHIRVSAAAQGSFTVTAYDSSNNPVVVTGGNITFNWRCELNNSY